MKTQSLPTKLFLLTCTCVAAICAAQEGVIAAADWNLFDSRESEVSEFGPFSMLSDAPSDAELGLRYPAISTTDALPTTSDAAAVVAEETVLKPATEPISEDCIEYGYGFDYAHPAARYAGDAYMVENDLGDKNADVSSDDAEDESNDGAAEENAGAASPDAIDDEIESEGSEEPENGSADEESLLDSLSAVVAAVVSAAVEAGPVEESVKDPFVLEDEESLAAALAAMASAAVEVGTMESGPVEDPAKDPFVLEDEASLADAIEMLDAARNKSPAGATAWVAVETEEAYAYAEGQTPIDDTDDMPEEAVHDWFYYDYTYEPDYFESTEAADDLYPDAYALDANAAADNLDANAADDDTAAGPQNDAELAGETGIDYPDYYEYDHGMFEYVGDEVKVDAADDSTDDADQREGAGQDPMNDPAGRSSDDGWIEYERTHRGDASDNEDADTTADHADDRVAADATDGAMFVVEPEEFDDEAASDEPLRRDEGTWDQGTWDRGTVDEGTVDEGVVEGADEATSPDSESDNQPAPADEDSAGAQDR